MDKHENNNRMKWHHWLELVFLPYFITVLIFTARDGGLYGVTINMLFNGYSKGITILILVGLVIQRVIGKNDFRFKIYVHLSFTIITVLTLGIFNLASGAFNSFVFDDTSAMAVYLIMTACTVLIAVGSIFSMFALTDPFTNEIHQLSEKITSGEISAQIEDTTIISDSVFGLPVKMINSIVTTSGTLINEMAETSVLIASSAEELASSAEEVNASAEEVSSTSQAMSHGATQQAQLISSIVNQMKDADDVIQDVVKQIQNNTEAVSQIALQTNILALNAGIEASRAGDYGRGFAVVAENVRKLSDQSKNSAEEISLVVDTISSTLQELFNEMQSGIMNVASVSEETAASAEEVAAAAEEMTSAMEGISNLSQNLSSQAEQSSQLGKIVLN
ncbi:MAG: methyl-accepting chemotaxis protein [Candidatus Kariarchaeaceae archaeon]|jgi:methyl-accepting chemotaxis protein